MKRKRKFFESLPVQYRLFFGLRLNLSRNLPLPFGDSAIPFIPQSDTRHCDNMLLLTRSGQLCNLLVQKLLGKRIRDSKWILSRLHSIRFKEPETIMDYCLLFAGNEELDLSKPKFFPQVPLKLCVTLNDMVQLQLQQGLDPMIVSRRKQLDDVSGFYSITYLNEHTFFVSNSSKENAGELWCFSGQEMKHVTTLRGHERKIGSCAFHPKLPIFATSPLGINPQIWIWDFSDPSEVKCITILEGHEISVFSLVFHPYLPILVSSGRDGQVILWILSPKSFALISKVVLLSNKQEDGISSIDFHPREPILACLHECGEITLVRLSPDFSSIESSKNLPGDHYTGVVNFHPDLPILVTSEQDNGTLVKFWHISSNSSAICIANLPFASYSKTLCVRFGSDTVAFLRSDYSTILAQ
jgi:WD40 repeat protein